MPRACPVEAPASSYTKRSPASPSSPFRPRRLSTVRSARRHSRFQHSRSGNTEPPNPKRAECRSDSHRRPWSPLADHCESRTGMPPPHGVAAKLRRQRRPRTQQNSRFPASHISPIRRLGHASVDVTDSPKQGAVNHISGCDRRVPRERTFGRRLRASQIAFVIGLTARRDGVHGTSRVRFATHPSARRSVRPGAQELGRICVGGHH